MVARVSFNWHWIDLLERWSNNEDSFHNNVSFCRQFPSAHHHSRPSIIVNRKQQNDNIWFHSHFFLHACDAALPTRAKLGSLLWPNKFSLKSLCPYIVCPQVSRRNINSKWLFAQHVNFTVHIFFFWWSFIIIGNFKCATISFSVTPLQ